MPITKKKFVLAGFAMLALGWDLANATAVCEVCTAADTSEICSPTSIDGYESIPFPKEILSQGKASRNTLIKGYVRENNRSVVNFYLFDRNGSGDDDDIGEMRDTVASLISQHEGVQLLRGERTSISVGGELREAHYALASWRIDGKLFMESIWGVPMENRFLKIRATTYVSASESLSSILKGSVADALKLADLVCR